MAKSSIGIGENYLKFFIDNIDSRHVICIGGRRSGKSYAIMRFLRFLISGKPKQAMIVAATFPALQLVMDDWTRATGLAVQGSILYGYSCQLKNGSVVQFRNFPEPQRAQGSHADIIFIDEVLNCDENTIRVLTMSCTGQIYMAANPTRKSRLIDDYTLPDGSNLLRTTYRDNPYLTPEQVQEFVDIEERASRPDATLYDIYMAKVYCRGEFADLVGRCFEKLDYNTYADWLDIPVEECITADLGFGGADETVILGTKMYKNRLYIHTYWRGKGTLDAYNFAVTLYECGFNEFTPIQMDWGGIGRHIIDTLISADNGRWEDYRVKNGFSICNVAKRPVLEGIMGMMALDAIVIDDSSQKTREEFENAQLTEDRHLKGSDHAIDAARYAYTWLKLSGF